MNENRPNPRTATPEEALFSLVIVAGDMICFVVGNKLGSAGVSIKLSEKGSVKQTTSRDKPHLSWLSLVNGRH